VSKKETSFKGRVEQTMAIAYLTELIAGMESGRVYVQNGNEYVELESADMVDMEIEATQKKGKSKFKLELSWSKEEATDVESSLKISTEKPEVAEPETPADDEVEEEKPEKAEETA